MNPLNKSISLLIVVFIVASCLIATQAVSAQSIPAPEFTVQWVDNSYNTKPTTSTNPYTGESTTNPSQHMINYTIQFSIRNQPYPETLYYNIGVKGHFEQNWTNVFVYEHSPRMSKSDYTLVAFSSQSNNGLYKTQNNGYEADIHAPTGGKIDFRVQAFVGYYTSNNDPSTPLGSSQYFTTTKGDWSSTQTVTIGESSPSPSVPEFPAPAILPLLVAIPLIAAVLLRKTPIKKILRI